MINDVGAERSVLAGLIKYGYEGYMDVSDIINVHCFTTDINQIIFKCIEHVFALDNQEVDIALLQSAANSLGLQQQMESDATQKFIRSLSLFPIEKSSIRPICAKIVKLNVVRKAMDAHKRANDKLSKISGDENLENILSISEEPYFDLLKVVTEENDITPIGDIVDEHLENIIENPNQQTGIPSPFKQWNYVIGGGLRTGVHLVAARFKIGKSSIGKETSVHVAQLGIPVLYIDTEMAKEEQVNRILAGMASVPIDIIENGKFISDPVYKNRLMEAKEKLKTIPFYHKNVAGKDFLTILNTMKRWIHKVVGFENGKPKPHLIIYDYFKLMETESLKNMQEYQAMGFQIAALHDFCQQYQTPILSFVQINRDGLTKDSTDVISQSDRLGWNCFSENQNFITSKGVKSFKDFKDKDEIIVLSHDGSWQKAIVRNYGQGYVNKLHFKNGNNKFTVEATNNHRWLLKNNKITDNIQINDILLKTSNVFNFDYNNATFEEQLYWCYGFVYGDGEYNGKISRVRLCGKDKNFESRFLNVGFKSSSSLSLKGDIICYTGSYDKSEPNPEIDSPNLIQAFVTGYLQADGTKNFNKGKKYISIQSSELSHINFIRKCFPIAGVFIISEKEITGQQTNYGIRPYTVLFTINDRPNGKSNNITKLEKIEVNYKFTNLWCLEVENTNSFVFPNGTPTGNCISLSIYKRKSPEEIAEDGIENGNMKMIPLEGRFMRRMDDGDYINFSFQGEYSRIIELKTRNALKKARDAG